MVMEFLKKIFSKNKVFPQKKVLVLEGGGMRGIFLTGVLQCFTEKKYFPWKLIIGSSAGALTGVAYTTGQIHLARDAFFTKLLSGKFIHLENILRHDKHILDLDWMINTIIKGNEQLDVNKLKKTWPVLITAVDCGNHRPETIYLDSKKDDIYSALKATAAIPFLYKGFIEYKHYQLLDGGLLDPIPYQKALSLGYKEKDILVVVTRKKGYRKKEESFWIRAIYDSYYKNPRYKYLVESMHNRYKAYNKILDELEYTYKDIDVIYPPQNFDVERLTQNEKKIMTGFEQGVHAANKYLFPGKYR